MSFLKFKKKSSMDKLKNSLKGYMPVLTTDVDVDDDPELGPSLTEIDEPSMLEGCFDLTWKQRITGFAMTAAAGAMFLFFSAFFSTGIVIGQTKKFIISYTFANIFLIISTTFLVGLKQQMKNIFEKKRLPLSIAYIGSLILALILTLKRKSIIFVLPTIIIQFISLVLYIISYLPGGLSAINFCGSATGRLLFRMASSS